MDRKAPDAVIQGAVQCAPVLAGIKPSNLLILEKADHHIAERLIEETGLSCEFLYAGKSRAVYLVYREEELAGILEDCSRQAFLRRLGYQSMNTESVLSRLKKRCKGYSKGKTEYPHELGILLGYPLGDVIGFIVHRGKDFIFSGYWKVYENEAAARETFEKYHYCRREARKMACQGKGFRELRRAFAGVMTA